MLIKTGLSYIEGFGISS